jgi:hypothetical protein
MRRVLGHWVVGKARKKEHLVVGLEVFSGKLEDILVEYTYTCWKMVSKPEQVYDVHLVASVEQFRDDYGTHIAGSSGDQKFHVIPYGSVEIGENVQSAADRNVDEHHWY